ncbi:MAG: outer membrane lipoprotein-sorting protein [Candidatus Thiodiazotropha sp. (ex Ctena orbiculata)]|uniref:Outer membrane lipoprotein-sorting protein n=1 Tax=Candidatus Thiodiazotropha taylori TaxID=2792791 RepID=A0A944M7J1_9GAMM|nr:outer membrane lipoprotein-sorting protein [Candidatus Thiodiazotropha taylori]MBT2987699.1 outer membrane lipoprotein-sorting protein [Candidatus Thiodiazotropha taylori]MBT2995060.1 outer membrane lipoprotein-sorting protein [Candidatus Thiodiazotropha taylori]MBT3000021.1 outer membrane lipoprotein-sorting protein [Candidatus Thiodiazotropha taylori]MBT3028042.1 outer membrane lipoprotein-sorting protein [Candidatus Thiodiazotropha taylori]
MKLSSFCKGSILSVLLSLSVLSTPLYAESPEEKGLSIAKEMDRRDLGWQDSASSVEMLLHNRAGETSKRQLRIEFLEVPELGLGDKSLVVFDEPRDIKGTAFLTHSKIHKEDDQWLYLPAIKRVKRISSVNKSGPFVGSEFAYEDLISNEVEKYAYRWVIDEACGELQCYVIEQFPVYKNSGYSRQVVWVDKDEYRRMKIEFYDRKEDLLKTLVYENYEQYLGQYWRALRLSMTNHQNGKSTELTFSPYEFQVGLTDNAFSRSRLNRLR